MSVRLSTGGAPALIEHFVSGFEGLLSTHANDNGNWYDERRYVANLPQRRNMGQCVGSMRGVTAYAYANCYGRTDITRATMASITLAQAIEIGVQLFYVRPGLCHLPWNRVTASILDKSWGSGPVATIKRLQKGIGAGQDGRIGKGGETVRLFTAWIKRLGEEGAALRWAEIRRSWDTAIATNEGAKDPDRVFLVGWNRRTDSWLPGTAFWKDW